MFPIIDNSFSFQVGANANQTISITLPNLQATNVQTFSLTTTGSSFSIDYSTLDVSNNTTAKAQGFIGRTVRIGNDQGYGFSYTVTQKDVTDIDANSISLGTAIASGLKRSFNAQFSGKPIEDNGSIGTASNVGSVFTLTASIAGSASRWDGLSSNVIVGKLSAIDTTDITSQASASSGLQAIDTALQAVNAERANMGAVISRLQFASDNLANVSAKAQESRSRIEDTDYSQATTELAKRNIIQQAAQAMLAQANQAPQLVLQLLK